MSCKLIIEYWGGSVSKPLKAPLPIGSEILTFINGEVITIAKVASVDCYLSDIKLRHQVEDVDCIAILDPSTTNLPIKTILDNLGFQ